MARGGSKRGSGRKSQAGDGRNSATPGPRADGETRDNTSKRPREHTSVDSPSTARNTGRLRDDTERVDTPGRQTQSNIDTRPLQSQTPASSSRNNQTVNDTRSTGKRIEDKHPQILWEDTRENLIKMRTQLPPKLKWNAATGKAVVVTDAEDDEDLDQDESRSKDPLPDDTTQEQANLADYWGRMMLFAWHNNYFAGFYTKKIMPTATTDSEAFLKIRDWILNKFRNHKNHFLWRNTYPWTMELVSSNRNLLDLVQDRRDIGDLQAFLLERLDANSFKSIFMHVRDIVDYNATKERDGHGIYFIRTVYVSLIVMMIKLIGKEEDMNRTEINDRRLKGKPPMKPGDKKTGWKSDYNYRREIRESFAGWGFMEDFMYTNVNSFAHFDKAMKTNARNIVDVDMARDNFVSLGRPPPPPPPPSPAHTPRGPRLSNTRADGETETETMRASTETS
ncbi:hypothetical protein K449DRAFT_401394 [Hypoxylon sp. EC38]|nr:hypothetical protein K449DRAFT_401394 [Hypoxylon sp. EC38]